MKTTLKRFVVAVLTAEAKLLLQRTKPKIIAITGSVGKTSTKDAIYAVLKDQVHARKSEKSFNSELGVPLSVLGLENAWSNPLGWLKNILDGFLTAVFPGSYPDVLVLEMGVDRPGDMKALTQWIKPDIVVLTRLPDMPVHVEFFSSPEAVIAEKLVLVEALRPDGVLVYNQDDERLAEIVDSVRQQAIGYSRYSVSQFTASNDQIVYENGRPAGIEFDLAHLDIEARLAIAGTIGLPVIYSCAAAAAVGSLFGVTLPEAMSALREHAVPAGRMRIIRGLKETTIIDDTYNSSPAAALRALSALREIKYAKRRIAVLGDMLELGQYSVREHEKLGQQAAECADVLVTVGVRSRKIAESAIEFGLSEKQVYQYEDAGQAAAEIQNWLGAGDVILVKASQSIRLERLVEELMAEPDQAADLLVRQDPVWRAR